MIRPFLTLLVATTSAATLAPAPIAAQGASARGADSAATRPVLASALRARAILERAIAAMGGLERIERITTIVREISGTNHEPAQGMRPRPQTELDPPAIEHFESLLALDIAGRRAFITRSGVIFGGQPYRLRYALTPTAGFQTNDTLRTIADVPSSTLERAMVGALRRSTERVLLDAWASPESLRWLGGIATPRGERDAITFAGRDGEQVTLAFDPTTGLLDSQISVGTGASLGDQEVAIELGEWRAAGNGLLLPHRMRERRNGVLFTDSRVTRVRMNEPLADSLFVRPASYAAEPPKPQMPTRLADGVYALEGTYNSLAVVFDDHVVVVEPVLSEGTTQRNLKWIADVAPGKPIRYVVATHFHSDHLAGLRGYLAAGATVLTTPDARAVIDRIVGAERRLRPDGGQRPESPPRVEVVTSRRVLADAHQALELHPIGPTPHVAEMLIAYLPRARVLFEGDLLDLAIAPNAVSMPGDDTIDLRRKLDALGLRVDIIVPVHGRLGTGDDLLRTVARASR